MKTALVLIMMVCLAMPVSAQNPRVPERFEEDILRFEQQLADGTSKPGSVLFIGSSSIRMWDLEKWFPGHATVNHGFGGSEISDSLFFFDRIVTPIKPSLILMYAGDNDISSGKTAKTVHRDFQRFIQRVKTDVSADTKVAFISIKPSIARWDFAEEMAKANDLIAKECATDAQLQFVDIWEPMLGEDGKPNGKLLREDGLHLTEHGYALWTSIVESEVLSSDQVAP